MGLEVIENMFSGVTASGVTNFAFVLTVIIISLLGVGFLAFLIIREIQFKYKVIIFEELSDGGTMAFFDKGRIKKRRNEGGDLFILKFHKSARMPVPPSNAMLYNQKGKKVVFLKKFGSDVYDFYPMGISLRGSDIYLKPYSLEHRENWISTEIKRAMSKFGSFWDKYGSMIVIAGLLIIGLVGIIIIFKMAQNVADSVAVAGSSIEAGSKAIADAVAKMGDASTQVISSNTPPGI